MKFFGLLFILEGLFNVFGENLPSVPACAMSCWENTKYVSRCFDDLACLCRDDGYQNSVFQCLYSQCDIAHSSSALHYAISQCSTFGSQVNPGARPIAAHDSLRRRMEAEYLAGSWGKRQQSGASAVPWPTESANFPVESAAFLIQSAIFPTQSANRVAGASASSLPVSLDVRNIAGLPTTIVTVLVTPTGHLDPFASTSKNFDADSGTARGLA
ncbi:hypothetical protein GLAREA_08154 [Glarea lozoyensis ATCC 20868]|uniref:CFEM domain-containing protein n=1 Tax=Glarea lozoyensis (strain ATCC 20868 / MF5171) TaxID=1116229 RepID=S3DCC8_GLAL2|nr:uncharacterized protein GLAREA_08154 [Glarea lozoyensis ATCC 20868]EPE24303.1 hypothetical protein GLAREA_08154 [Glarea lozoyensis ATCC 20868]